MKKFISCLVLVLALSVSLTRADAQTYLDKDTKISLGFRTGVNFSSMEGDMDGVLKGVREKNRTSITFGAIVDFPLIPDLYLQSGLFYVQKGFNAKGESGMETGAGNYLKVSAKNRASYLQVPVLLSVRPCISQKVRIHLDMGTFFAYGIHGKQKVKDLTYRRYTLSEIEAMGLKDGKFFGSDGDYNHFDFGLVFGTGITFHKISIGLQYEKGLINIGKRDSWQDVTYNNRRPSFQTSNISLLAGYTF